MMLLQAGQAGLYRRDSIWTDSISPDMYADCTLWLDGTDSSSLFDGLGLMGANVSSDGQGIASARNKVNPSAYLDQSDSSFSQVVLKTASAGSRSAVHVLPGFPGSGKPLGMVSSEGIGDWVSAANKLFVVGVKVNAAVDLATPIGTAPIIGSTSLSVGIYAYEDANPESFLLYGVIWNGGTIYYVETRLPREAYAVVTMQHQSNQLRMRVNGGAWVTVACPAIAVIGSGAVGIGGAELPMDFELAHAFTFNAGQTDPAINAVERWLANDVGIAPW